MSMTAPANKPPTPATPPVPAPAGPRGLRRLTPHAEDREFLPAAMEILETPPSVIAVRFIWLICAIVAAAIAWSYFGKLDIYAVANGKIQLAGRSKVVQPVDPGKVAAVFVQNGSRVSEGDILLELDPTETAADRDKLARDLAAADAEAARRRAAIEQARAGTAAPPVAIAFRPDVGEEVRAREQKVLAADIAQLSANLASLQADLAKGETTERKLNDSIAEREKLLALSRERVKMREELAEHGSGSRAMVIDAMTQLETEMTTQVSENGQLRENVAAMDVTRRKMAEAVSQFIADQSQKLAEAERKRDQLTQDLVKAQTRNERTRLRAPVTGVVQQLAVTTVGQVVNSGQALMTVVPLDAPIEIEAMIQNKDIGFVAIGQPAVVKIDSFPFTRYGTLAGTVTRVSSDAVDMRDSANLSDAAAAVKAQGVSPNTPQSRPELAFPATIKLERRTMEIDGRPVNLTPGMTATVEINTGRRRVIDYALSPLREAISQSRHER
jgi:hemolysin D